MSHHPFNPQYDITIHLPNIYGYGMVPPRIMLAFFGITLILLLLQLTESIIQPKPSRSMGKILVLLWMTLYVAFSILFLISPLPLGVPSTAHYINDTAQFLLLLSWTTFGSWTFSAIFSERKKLVQAGKVILASYHMIVLAFAIFAVISAVIQSTHRAFFLSLINHITLLLSTLVPFVLSCICTFHLSRHYPSIRSKQEHHRLTLIVLTHVFILSSTLIRIVLTIMELAKASPVVWLARYLRGSCEEKEQMCYAAPLLTLILSLIVDLPPCIVFFLVFSTFSSPNTPNTPFATRTPSFRFSPAMSPHSTFSRGSDVKASPFATLSVRSSSSLPTIPLLSDQDQHSRKSGRSKARRDSESVHSGFG
ncbi:hypothetical protein BLNAU_17275 [Blattamonas nauphoetae]|uniref:Uncharacterized protein n=1 Tax=Blattamonas nauphoetae TaxID=2049346 RepID=A0ABQ9XBV5_9EUKA|nr:hypothetical protein BLNAU_17275 [Blattamonas nauphoetae]